MPRVLVTGAAGFIGTGTVRAFRAAGWQVRAAARSTPLAADPAVEWRAVGNIESPAAWEGVATGIDCIVHLAARAHVARETERDPLAKFRAVNVVATKHLLAEAARAGVGRIVFLSSIGVNGQRTTGTPFRETDTPRPETAYARSKWEAEEVVRAGCDHARLEYVVLRAPLVYGPGAPGSFSRLAAWIRRERPLPLASVRNRRSLCYVGNLVDAIVRCAAHPAAANRVFLVADGEAISTPELISSIAAALNVRARCWPFPPALLRALVHGAGGTHPIESLIDSLEVDCGLIRRALTWDPVCTTAEGLNRTIARTF
jgi:nucleoside-diphosphate-sugar epimerase